MTTNTRFHITRISSNSKTGPIPVTTTSEDSCPASCPLYGGGCYAKSGPLALHWRKVGDSTEKRSIDADTFLASIKALPRGQLFRHNQAGDLPHHNGVIDKPFTEALVKASKGKRGFTYTHHEPHISDNAEIIRKANRDGFTVNLSGNNISHAIAMREQYALPVVTILPMDAPNVQHIDGHKVVACPAEKSDKITCANCALCADSERNYIIGFRVHGTQKRKANIIASA